MSPAVRHLSAIVAALLLAGMGACKALEPPVLMILENPDTGERVVLYEELWFKVPTGYDEEQHVADWSAKQRAEGFTVEVAQAR